MVKIKLTPRCRETCYSYLSWHCSFSNFVKYNHHGSLSSQHVEAYIKTLVEDIKRFETENMELRGKTLRKRDSSSTIKSSTSIVWLERLPLRSQIKSHFEFLIDNSANRRLRHPTASWLELRTDLSSQLADCWQYIFNFHNVNALGWRAGHHISPMERNCCFCLRLFHNFEAWCFFPFSWLSLENFTFVGLIWIYQEQASK